MPLSPGMIEEGTQLYCGRGFVQMVLLLIVAVCVPWMLCVKLYLLREMKHIRADDYTELRAANDDYCVQHKDLKGEEEGHGGMITVKTNEEHVSLMAFCFLFLFLFVD